MPFSSKNFSDVLSCFFFKENSIKADSAKDTISSCKASSLYEEQKYCSVTLESFVHSASAKLGENLTLLSIDNINTNITEFMVAQDSQKTTKTARRYDMDTKAGSGHIDQHKIRRTRDTLLSQSVSQMVGFPVNIDNQPLFNLQFQILNMIDKLTHSPWRRGVIIHPGNNVLGVTFNYEILLLHPA
ncbi:hypothetical protein PTKIN_Ptkin11bG0183400 [Pterospermum kingtungense]